MRKRPGTTERPGAPATPAVDPNPAGPAPSKTLAASVPKSLMKTSELGGLRAAQRRPGTTPGHAPAPAGPPRRKASPTNISGSRQQKIEERIAAATEELSAGITEAASAAAQETLAAAANTATTLLQARDRSEVARRRTDALETLLMDTSNQIGTW